MYIIIVGGGKVGEYLANVLLNRGNSVAIIESSAKNADHLSTTLNGDALIINGDGCDSKYQEDAGIRRADVFVAATGQDDGNLVSCEIVKRVFGVKRCIARVNNPKNIRIFRELGIETVSSTTLIANMIEEEALMGGVNVVTDLARENIRLTELTVPRMRNRDENVGIRLSEITLPDDCVLVAVQTKRGVMVATRDVPLRPGDKVVVAGAPEAAAQLDEFFKGL